MQRALQILASGLRQPGNIDLANQPKVLDPVPDSQGRYGVSTVRSMSFGDDNGETLIPTVSPQGRLLSDDLAQLLYALTGKHLGIFDTPEHATAYGERLHNEYAAGQHEPTRTPRLFIDGERIRPAVSHGAR